MNKDLKQIPVSEKLDGMIDHCIAQLKQEQKQMKRRQLRKLCISLSTAAAILLCTLFLRESTPGYTEGSLVFARIADFINGSPHTSSEYVQESNGMRITLSEIYHDCKTIYMRVQLDNQMPFPQEILNGTAQEQCGKLELLSEIQFDFNGQPVTVTHSSFPEGAFTDNKTFTGTIAIPLSELQETKETVKLPKDLNLSFHISLIYDWPSWLWAYASDNAMLDTILPRGGHNGNWNFNLNIPRNLVRG